MNTSYPTEVLSFQGFRRKPLVVINAEDMEGYFMRSTYNEY